MNFLSAEILENPEKFKDIKFKPINFSAKGRFPKCGAIHPLMKVRSQFRTILCDLGFEEMPTNRYVESSFWNFDALFQPQRHPVRDAHDTFYIKNPKYAKIVDQPLWDRVKEMHEKGGHGSLGHSY